VTGDPWVTDKAETARLRLGRVFSFLAKKRGNMSHHLSTMMEKAQDKINRNWVKKNEYTYGGYCLLGGLGSSVLDYNRKGDGGTEPYQKVKGKRETKILVQCVNCAIRCESPLKWLGSVFVAYTFGIAFVAQYRGRARIVMCFNDMLATEEDVERVMARALTYAMKQDSKEAQIKIRHIQRMEKIRGTRNDLLPKADEMIRLPEDDTTKVG
jgi:hypothetical protein